MTDTVLGANIRLVFGLERNTMPFSGPTMMWSWQGIDFSIPH
jgi:hypothetical protein